MKHSLVIRKYKGSIYAGYEIFEKNIMSPLRKGSRNIIIPQLMERQSIGLQTIGLIDKDSFPRIPQLSENIRGSKIREIREIRGRYLIKTPFPRIP